MYFVAFDNTEREIQPNRNKIGNSVNINPNVDLIFKFPIFVKKSCGIKRFDNEI